MIGWRPLDTALLDHPVDLCIERWVCAGSQLSIGHVRGASWIAHTSVRFPGALELRPDGLAHHRLSSQHRSNRAPRRAQSASSSSGVDVTLGTPPPGPFSTWLSRSRSSTKYSEADD